MEASPNIRSTTAGPTADAGVFRVETMQLDSPLVAAFGQRLHEAGLSVTPAQSGRYVRALQLTQPRSRQQLYFTTRAIFVTDLEHVATFDRVFAETFGTRADDVDYEPVMTAARSPRGSAGAARTRRGRRAA